MPQRKRDEGHELTDIELAALEQRIRESYGNAVEELEKIIEEYFNSFQKRDEEMKKLIGNEINGKVWTEEDYKQWRLAQMGRGQRFEAMRSKLAERLTRANEVAVAYVNDKTPGIYTLNRNYAAYEIESAGTGIDFTLYDESTVRRLVVERPSLMPYYPVEKALKRGIDLEYGKKQITASVTSGILMGSSTRKIAADLRERIVGMSVESALRAARTAATAAENGGRQASYERAAEMGVEMTREWLAVHDARTRHAHGAADGQRVAVDEPFIVGGEELMFPGDTSRGASGWNIYNCRCSLVSAVKGHERKRETYSQWLQKKQGAPHDGMQQVQRRQTPPQEKEYFRFQPAKTQQEATEYMNRIVKDNGTVEIGKGVTLEQENAINMALTDVHNRYGVKLDLRAIKHANGDYQAAYNPQSGTLLVKGNKTTWEHNAKKQYSSGFGASDDAYQVFYHELGHAMWEELPQTAQSDIETLYKKYTHRAYLEWREMGGSSSGKGQADVFQKYLSKYGHQNKHEFFAECFTQIMTDFDGEAAFDVGEILDEVFKHGSRF